MNSKKKIALYVALIFLAGGVAGGSIGWTASTRQHEPRHRREFPDAKRMGEFMLRRLEERVGLTQEQVATLRPILEQSAQDIREVHGKALQEVEAVIRRTHEEIAATLTPEQKIRLDEVEKERREFWRKHFKKKDQRDRDEDGEREKHWDRDEDHRDKAEPNAEEGPNACNSGSRGKRRACA